jgi:LytS/YehU family sensor histidine kinase
VVFYANYFSFIPKLLLSKKLVIFFIVNLMLYSACIVILETSKDIIRPGPPEDQAMKKPPSSQHEMPMPLRGGPSQTEMILMAFIAFAMTTGVAVAIRTTTQWFRSEDLRKDLEREHLKSELANLKNQLNPHFFFNTLNNIYSLINQNQEKAQDSIIQLSKLMRYLLYDSNEKYVPLKKEIEFIHHYIDLMKLRITPNVSVKYSLPKETGGYNIAPLLFISLIENSFKHGISLGKPSEIEMDLKIDDLKDLIFNIRNTSFPKSDKDRSGSGIGLENLKKRLALLYPHKHTLEVKSDENYYQAILTVRL